MKREKQIGFITFFFSGICAISSGVIVSMLQETYGFAYSMTGTLLSLMNIGNLLAGFLAGVLPSRLGTKRTIAILTSGYFIGYLSIGLTKELSILLAAFFLLGIAKGSTINTCTILVSNHTTDRTKDMNIMHSCYAMGALLCPFIITMASLQKGVRTSVIVLAILGLALWFCFFSVPMEKKQQNKAEKTDWSFLKSHKFWLLTGLLFCQNAAETSVTGWMVTYFKGTGIISGSFSPYTVTVMWGATLIARLLIAYIIPIKDPLRAMIRMGIGCIIFYTALMFAHTQLLVILLLGAFALSMAGMNPTAVAHAGKMTSVTSMGVMLPVASLGAIIMPWMIGIVAQTAGLQIGMLTNVIPCIGLLLFSIALKYMSIRSTGA